MYQQKKIELDILSSYNFGKIVDISAGMGELTHQFIKRNNRGLGLDISPTAIEVTCARFPDIEFDVANAENLSQFISHLYNKFVGTTAGSGVDLVFTRNAYLMYSIRRS